MRNGQDRRESGIERVVSAAMMAVFWTAFCGLGAGLALWLVRPMSVVGTRLLTGGLLGLLLIPMLRLLWAMATAAARRDWVLFGATVTVLAILLALTLREAATLKG